MMPRRTPPAPFEPAASTLEDADGLTDEDALALAEGDADLLDEGRVLTVADAVALGELVGGALITIWPHIPEHVPSKLIVPWIGQ